MHVTSIDSGVEDDTIMYTAPMHESIVADACAATVKYSIPFLFSRRLVRDILLPFGFSLPVYNIQPISWYLASSENQLSVYGLKQLPEASQRYRFKGRSSLSSKEKIGLLYQVNVPSSKR